MRPPLPRPMTVADVPEMVALIRLAFAAQPILTDPPPNALRETVESVTAHLSHGGGAVIAEGAALIGGVLWEAREGGLYFGRLAVHPARRRRGVARALVAAAEAEARRLGLPRVHLSTRLPLLDNRRLFAACGYVETEQRAHPGYSAPTTVAMEKWLR